MADLLVAEGLALALPDFSRRPLLGAAPRVAILRGVSFALGRGEVLGIVGGSGSGKTTLGRCLLRLLEPTGGRVVFDGVDVTHLPEPALGPFRRRAGMVFQDPLSALNPRHTVRRLLLGPVRLHGLPEARAAEALDMVGLPEALMDRYPHEISGGQRQRVGIARAVALRPDFLLCDEVVSGLDLSSQAQVLNLLGGLARELGLALAFISHDLGVVRHLCSRVLVLEGGVVAEEGAVAELFERPRSQATRALLDAIALPDPDQAW